MTQQEHRQIRETVRAVDAWAQRNVGEEVLDRLAGPTGLAQDDDERFRRLTRRIFAQGLPMYVVLQRWDVTLRRLGGGDPAVVALMGAEARDRFLEDERVLRNAAKLDATIHNARVFVALRQTYGDLQGYVAAFGSETGALLDDISARFRRLGAISAARFAQEMGADPLVPHPAVLRFLRRRGWLARGADAAAIQQLGRALVPDRRAGFPRGRLSAALLAFATGHWADRGVCTPEADCEACPVWRGCELGAEQRIAARAAELSGA